jgi:outer membrane protein
MNNKALVGINVVLIIAVVVLFILHFTGGATEQPIAEADIPLIEDSNVEDSTVALAIEAEDLVLPEFKKGLKIAFVNSDSLNKNYKFFGDAKKKIAKELEKAQAKMAGKENSLRRKYAELERKAKSGEMWNDEVQVEAQKLQQQEMALGQEAQLLQEKVGKMEYEETLKVIDITADYLNEIGKELGYDYVMTYSKSNQIILFANPELDITEYVTLKLNQAYGSLLAAGIQKPLNN